MKNLSVYIHIPFCKRKCYYCDFSSFQNCSHSDIDEYMKHLLREIELYRDLGKSYRIDTLFIGGGTPSMISSKWIEKLLFGIREVFSFTENPEISIEGNPDTLTYEKMAHYFELEINRLSIGLQSDDRKILKTLGRIHGFEDFLESLEDARRVGYKNINSDLMFGLPGQSLNTFQNTLVEVTKLKIPHISAYGLIINENTIIGERIEQGILPEPDEDVEVDMYNFLRKFLMDQGYEHYEISNFGKPGFQCRHNRTYWKNRNYLGLGLGAHSSMDGVRFYNLESFSSYHQKLQAGEKPIAGSQDISKEEQLRESLMLGLRLTEGIAISCLESRYKTNVEESVLNKFNEFTKLGLLETSGNRLRLTEKGFYLSNSVFREIIQ